MTRRKPKKATAAEEAYIADIGRESAFDKLDRGEATVLKPDQYPEPVKRFLQRERSALRIHLSTCARRRLASLSRSTGTPADALARQFIEAGLARRAS